LHLTLANAILSTILFPAAFPGLAAVVGRRSGGGTVDIGMRAGVLTQSGSVRMDFAQVVKAGEVGGPVGEFGFWDRYAGMSCKGRDVGGGEEGVLSGCEERLGLAREEVDRNWE
jgi:hypothetical protein